MDDLTVDMCSLTRGRILLVGATSSDVVNQPINKSWVYASQVTGDFDSIHNLYPKGVYVFFWNGPKKAHKQAHKQMRHFPF